jgi:glycosyltransferase involved in cell wall biosynthesis
MVSNQPSKPSRGERVSVCLLAYNHVAALADTVRSVLAQTLPSFEFIISDDCSTDGTWEVAKDLARNYPNIRAIQTPRNLGMCGNANFAVSHAAGDYIALLHHDDVYRQDLLERWLEVIERYNNVAFVFNECACPREDGVWLGHKDQGRIFPELIPGQSFLENELLGRWGCYVWGTAMIRRSCWEAVGGMRTEFGMLADVDLWMRLAARWDVGYVADPLITLCRKRPDYYPAEYRTFSWGRTKLLYSIHASNLAQHYAKAGLRYWWKWLQFRTRVSLETCKWLTYALIRKRIDIIRESAGGECAWEFVPVRWYRNCLMWGHRMGVI